MVVSSYMTNGYIREALLAIARPLTSHVNIVIVPGVQVVGSIITSSLRDFVRMNIRIFLVSKVGEDPYEFLDDGYKM